MQVTSAVFVFAFRLIGNYVVINCDGFMMAIRAMFLIVINIVFPVVASIVLVIM